MEMNIGTPLLLASCGLIILTVIVFLASSRKVVNARNQGIYPEEGDETDEDVLRLLKVGEKILAIRCYREIHKVGLKEAKEAVERINIQS